jgi:hypothetical protein
MHGTMDVKFAQDKYVCNLCSPPMDSRPYRAPTCSMRKINPLNAQLNAICQFLALLGAHPILHVSRIRIKVLYSASSAVLQTRLIRRS